MSDYSDNMNNIQNKTLYDIEEQYKEMISEHRKKTNSKIQDCIEEVFRGIPKEKIEEWIEELFLEDFKIKEKQNFNEIEKILDDYKRKIPKELEGRELLINVLYNYQEDLIDILKKHNIYNLKDLISHFSIQISNKILNYLGGLEGISVKILTKIYELKFDIKRIIESVMTEYYEEYNFKIINILNKNIKMIQENVNQIETRQKSQENLEKFVENIIYSGYKLIIENNKIYAQDLKNGEKIELVYNEKEKSLLNKEKGIVFIINNKFYGSLDKQQNRITLVNDNKIDISDIYGQHHIEIIKSLEGYEFKYGEKNIEDLTQIGIIISEIKSKSPHYYEKLLCDENFKIIIEKTKEQEERHKDIEELKNMRTSILPVSSNTEENNSTISRISKK